MSGLLEEVSTPCPSRLASSRLERSRNGSDAYSSLWEDSLSSCDDTANLDFTAEIKAPVLTGAKPRRRTKTSTAFSIHDDGGDKSAPTTKMKREPGAASTMSNRKPSLLAQPAQRFRPKVSFAPSPISKHVTQQGRLDQRRESERVDVEKNKELLMQINGNTHKSRPKDALKKDVRRNTIYIPPDDTTVASVFMGIFSPLKSDPSNYQVNDGAQFGSLELQIMKKRQAMQSKRPSAQRVPLQQSVKVAQEQSIYVDIPGKNGGKENVPPGTVLMDSKNSKSRPDNPMPGDIKPICIPTAPPARTSISKPLAAKTTNGSLHKGMHKCRNNAKFRSSHVDGENGGKVKETRPLNRAAPSSKTAIFSNSFERSRIGINLPTSVLRTSSLQDEYPLIPEDITNSSMYDDNWLSHQEVVVAQLINDLFHSANRQASCDDPAILRHELLSIYQDASFAHLYQRVRASLLYGAMSIPKNVLSRSRRLKQDVGMKRKFFDFWLQTYDSGALRAAVETITGRQILEVKSKQDSTNASAHPSNNKILVKRLEHFLDTFLLQNQDMDPSAGVHDEKDIDAAGRAYRRTVLRSIMVIVLLDKAQTTARTSFPRLFLAEGQFNSSAAVLKGLAGFLLPSCGDIIKALGHLDCHLSYEESPLQGYEFAVENLAVDMRDGVRLTRIVELLLYPSSTDQDSQWPLSGQLKFPCLSRAVKVFNVQIALDALRSTAGFGKLVSHVRAEDIVDGHREKTISLLWNLVSKWGQFWLLDWGDVRKEIERLRQKAISQLGYDQVVDIQAFATSVDKEESITLLRQWATILAQLKGLRLENFTTSFGDGKIYESIVHEYEPYIIGQDCPVPSLHARLRGLGCSAQFATLIAPLGSKSHIPDHDFTVGALTFLCARLLSATKRARSAIVLQKAWRRILRRQPGNTIIVYRVLNGC
ncbi:hypothetical protein BDV59DRAFT_190127 [Aspergillus ambiguus]|uniref:putative calmodulin-binding protein Sha1 n=1 Tax=Aspergillus ambiguus TaxID=176160 RepID=UPI003CCE3726